MIHYFIEVSIGWFILYGLYFLFLRNETFFGANRWFLLNSLWIGLVIPALRNIPLSLKKAQTILAEPIELINSSAYSVSSYISHPIEEPNYFSIYTLLLIIYTAGVLLTGIRMFLGLFKIMTKIKNGNHIPKENYTLVVSQKKHLPFSFFRFIFINESFLKNKEFQKVLNHEIKHVSSGHTFDVLFLELLSIAFWWNPLIYFYKKAIRQTHEFIADSYASQYIDKKNYGHILLGQSSSGIELALTNQFFNSHLKKRINMLFKEKSANSKRSRYLLLIPFVCFLAILFSANTSSIDPNNPPQDLIDQLDKLLVEDKFIRSHDMITSFESFVDLHQNVLNDNASLFTVHGYLMKNERYKPYKNFIQERIINEGKKYGKNISFSPGEKGDCMYTSVPNGHFQVENLNETNEIKSGELVELTIDKKDSSDDIPQVKLVQQQASKVKVTSCDDDEKYKIELVVNHEVQEKTPLDVDFIVGDYKLRHRFELVPRLMENEAQMDLDQLEIPNELVKLVNSILTDQLILNNPIKGYKEIIETKDFKKYKNYIDQRFITKGHKFDMDLIFISDGQSYAVNTSTPSKHYLKESNEALKGMRLMTPSDYKGKLRLKSAYLFTLMNVSKKANWTPHISISNEKWASLELVEGHSTNESIDFFIIPKNIGDEDIKLKLICKDGADVIEQKFEIIEAKKKVDKRRRVSGNSLLPEHMKNPLWVINGKISDSKDEHYFTEDKILEVKVVGGPEAIQRFGIRGKRGAIEVRLKE